MGRSQHDGRVTEYLSLDVSLKNKVYPIRATAIRRSAAGGQLTLGKIIASMPFQPDYGSNMMSFSAGTDMNISGGTFNNVNRDLIQNTNNFGRLRNNDVGRDQINLNNQIQVQILHFSPSLSLFGPRQTPLPSAQFSQL